MQNLMNDTEQYVLNTVKNWVWSGFYQAFEVHEMVEDILEEDVDEDAIHAAIDAEFDRKADEESTWPTITDCDRLDQAFIELDKSGICTVQNAGYTMSDGFSDVAEALADRGREKYRGFCFYHGQDLERAIEGHGLVLAFGDLNEVKEKMIQIGNDVKAQLEKAGFGVEWDGTADTRINIPKIDWKRRY